MQISVEVITIKPYEEAPSEGEEHQMAQQANSIYDYVLLTPKSLGSFAESHHVLHAVVLLRHQVEALLARTTM